MASSSGSITPPATSVTGTFPFTSSFSDPTVPTSGPGGNGGGNGGGGGGGGGNGGFNSNGGIASSASLYLYTFLATLVLLLSVSAAIILRSLLMRRRHRRMVEEAIRNGTWIPPPPETGTFGTGRARVDLSRKPKLWDAYLGTTEKSAQTEWDWESIRPFSASYIAPPPGDATNGANAAGGRAVASAQTPRLSYPQRVTRFFHPDRPEFTAQYQLEARTPATDAAATPNVAGGNEEVVPTPPKQIRVAVLIAMPHRGPERNTGVASSSTAPPRLHVDDDEELPHLEFGVALLDVHDTDEAHHVADADKVEGRRSSASGGSMDV